MITNLLNCVLSPELLDIFEATTETRNQLLLSTGGNVAECSGCADPLAYEAACAAQAQRQLLRMRSVDADVARLLLVANPDIRLLYAVDAKTTCHELKTVESLLRQESGS
jgi:hypothetical protein